MEKKKVELKKKYNINGVLVHMTRSAAIRWNNQCSTERDLENTCVRDGERLISLEEALDPETEPRLSKILAGNKAVLIK